MKFFIDTANVDEIREAASWGVLDGVTTNPTLIAREGRDFREIIEEICSIVDGPVSAEVVSLETDGMLSEARDLAKIHKNIAIKIPLTIDGLKAVKVLSREGINTNVTLCFSSNQALLAAKAGATYISPFVGRLDDIDSPGIELIDELRMMVDEYNFSKTKILAASIRSVKHLHEVLMAGADIATVPVAVLEKAAKHPLTDRGIETFMEDWKKLGIKQFP